MSQDMKESIRDYDCNFSLYKSEINAENIRNQVRGYKKFEKNIVINSQESEDIRIYLVNYI